MQDIVKLVAAKAGISEPIARIAVEAVVSVLKNKLPAAIANQVDSFLGTGTGKATASTGTAKTKSSAGAAKTTTKKVSKAAPKKEDNPLGGLTDLLGGLGGLLGKK